MASYAELARKWSGRTAECLNATCKHRWTTSTADTFDFLAADGQPDFAVVVKCPVDGGDARILAPDRGNEPSA